MASLYKLHALVEGLFGVVVFIYPAFLFADAHLHPTLFTAGRMAGAAMLSLGVISYQADKLDAASKRILSKGFLGYHASILLLAFYTYANGGYLPGPIVEGVPVVMKLVSNVLVHGLFTGWFLLDSQAKKAKK